MADRPDCLHVPVLYMENGAFLFWGEAEEATVYQLEASFDCGFEEASIGLSWEISDARDRAWIELDTDPALPDWQAIERQPAAGLNWYNLEYASMTWAELGAMDLRWREMAFLPVSFKAYEGLGVEVPGPDIGRTSGEVDGYGLSRTEFKTAGPQDDGYTGRELEALAPMGLTWRDSDARYLSWQEIRNGGLSWEAFEALPSDSGAHRGWTIRLPDTIQSVTFRVRSKDSSGDVSEWLTTIRHPVVSVTEIDLTCRNDRLYSLQIEGGRVQNLTGVHFVLLYDPLSLCFERFARAPPDSGGHVPVILRNESGKVEFMYKRPIDARQVWSGLLVRPEFTALADGEVHLRLERFGENDKRVV